MNLSEHEDNIYQNALKYVADLSLNLMAVKVEDRPDNFLGWCSELNDVCRQRINLDLLEAEQLPSLKKLQVVLEQGISFSQLKVLRIAPWPIFVDFVKQQADVHALAERQTLLNYVDALRSQNLAEMSDEDRLTFAGKHTSKHDVSIYNFDVEWFAGTKGAKVFHSLLAQHPSDFDKALANIPLEGDVEREHYSQFVIAYKDIFSRLTDGDKPPLAAATRLLAMRRPDVFVALTNAKIEALCQGFGLAKFKNTDFNAYWSDLIQAVQHCAWWKQPEPSDESELAIWQARALFIDVFTYADESLAKNSNFIRLRDKPARKTSGSGTGVRRSKESAEALVDKALAADDLPDYLQSKRDAIINEVKKGKTVDSVIGLMRTIFG